MIKTYGFKIYKNKIKQAFNLLVYFLQDIVKGQSCITAHPLDIYLSVSLTEVCKYFAGNQKTNFTNDIKKYSS